MFATSNKCIATRNKGLTSSNKKLVEHHERSYIGTHVLRNQPNQTSNLTFWKFINPKVNLYVMKSFNHLRRLTSY